MRYRGRTSLIPILSLAGVDGAGAGRRANRRTPAGRAGSDSPIADWIRAAGSATTCPGSWSRTASDSTAHRRRAGWTATPTI